jgi:hypothetical protein
LLRQKYACIIAAVSCWQNLKFLPLGNTKSCRRFIIILSKKETVNRMTIRNKTLVLALASCALVAGLAACGGGGGTESSSTTTTTTTPATDAGATGATGGDAAAPSTTTTETTTTTTEKDGDKPAAEGDKPAAEGDKPAEGTDPAEGGE